MPILAAALAVLCCILLLLWLSGRRALAAARAEATATSSTLRAEIEAQRDEIEALQEQLDEGDAERASLTGDLDRERERSAELELAASASTAEAVASLGEAAGLADEVGTLTADLDQRQAALDAERTALEQHQEALAQHQQSLEEKQRELDGLVSAQRQLERELEDAHEAAARARGQQHRVPLPEIRLGRGADSARSGVDPGTSQDPDDSNRSPDPASLVDLPPIDAHTVWNLELVRSERTWRYSVSSNPLEDPSPFDTTDDPLRLAVEIEALALREDVGAFIGVRWDASPVTDPARAHLLLRLAQELMASAAREAEPSELVVSEGDRGVSIKIVAADEDDVDFRVAPPVIASDWIDPDTDEIVVS